MSIFQRIFGIQSQKNRQLPQGELLPSVTINFNRRITGTSEQEIYEIYKNSSLIQSCVNLWVNEFISAPCKPYVAGKLFEGAHLDIFSVDVMKELIFQILLSGSGFIYKIRNENGNLMNVQILSGFHVVKNYDDKGYLKDWSYQTSKGTFTIAKDDIVPITWFSTSTDDKDFGISPISTIINQAEQINELQRFLTDIASNDFVPRTILSAPPNMNLTISQQKQIIDQVREEFQTNPGSIKVLNGGWTISRLALGLDEMDTQALRIVPEADICGSFQVPPTILHTVAGMQNSTYNNVETSRKFFIQNTIGGMWSRVVQTINDNFKYEFPSQPEWNFETSNLPSMKEDTNSKFARLSAMYQANAISRAEFRAELDLEDIDDGQQVFYQDLIAQAGFSALGLAEQNPEAVQIASEEKPKTKRQYKKKSKGIIYPANDVQTKAVFWRKYNRITTRNSNDFGKIVNRMIDDMKNRTITAVRLNSRFIANGNLKREDFQAYNEGIMKAQEDVRSRIANDLGFAFDDLSPDAQNELRDLMNRTSDEMFLSMEKMIADTETELSLITGDTIEDKIEAIDKRFEKFKNVNSPAVTDYSANNITAGTQEIIFKDKGIKYQWLTQRDGRVRATHRSADGQLPDESGFFTLGDGERTKRPCAPGMSAKNSMRCRCILYPVE